MTTFRLAFSYLAILFVYTSHSSLVVEEGFLLNFLFLFHVKQVKLLIVFSKISFASRNKRNLSSLISYRENFAKERSVNKPTESGR